MTGKGLVIDSTDWRNCGKEYQIRARQAGSQNWTQVDFPNQEIPEIYRDDPHMVDVIISEDGDLSTLVGRIDVHLDCETTTGEPTESPE